MKKHKLSLTQTMIQSYVFNVALHQKKLISKNTAISQSTPSHVLLIPYFNAHIFYINQYNLKYCLNNTDISCISTLIINKSNDTLYITGFYSVKKANYIQMVYGSEYQIFKLHSVECVDRLAVPVKDDSSLSLTKPMVEKLRADNVKKHLKHLLMVGCLNLKIYRTKNIKSSAYNTLPFFPPKKASFIATLITYIAEKTHTVLSLITYTGLYIKFMGNALTACNYDFLSLSMAFKKSKYINNS